ncbi:MAG: helix-turn-helix domain-containing protein [Rhizobium sp.]|nr:helix-turn-helix domain-containing protein [Rhizobium sp.]
MRPAAAARVPTYGLYGEPQAGSPEFWIHAETIESRSRLHNWEIRQHRHETFYQILQIRTGEGDAVFGRERLRLTAGTVVMVPPGVVHGFRFSQDLNGQVITMLATRVSARPGCLMRFMSRPWLFRIEPGSEGTYLMATLDRIEQELALHFAPRAALLEACLDVVLALAADRIDSGDDPTETSARDRVARLNALIGAHYRQHRPAAFYAGELGLSVTHLNRIARSGVGKSLNELLTDRLIAEARRNLVFSLMTIQQIAYELGYSDPAYFTRAFQRATGETPGAFRKRERSQPSFSS